MLTRRDFLKASSLVALAPTVPVFLARTAAAAETATDRRILVVVQLDGGNDALNTVLPFADPNYVRLRPKLQIPKKELVPLSDALGLHPSLAPLGQLLEAGSLAVVPGVGYPNPNRSHFQSMAVWHTARLDPEEYQSHGWLGRALDSVNGSSYAINGSVPGALRGRRSVAVALTHAEDVLLADGATAKRAIGPEPAGDLLAFVRRQAIEGHAAADNLATLSHRRDEVPYPSTGLASRLRLVAQLLKTDLPTQVFYTLQTGYDTHASQAFTHANLLREFAEAVTAFFADLTAAKLAERVVLLAFSEFGRTIQENASSGTDHGTAGCVFLIGPSVRGGVHGTMPSLTDLELCEPKPTTDFRRLYATVLEDWLGLPAREAVAGTFERLLLFRN